MNLLVFVSLLALTKATNRPDLSFGETRYVDSMFTYNSPSDDEVCQTKVSLSVQDYKIINEFNNQRKNCNLSDAEIVQLFKLLTYRKLKPACTEEAQQFLEELFKTRQIDISAVMQNPLFWSRIVTQIYSDLVHPIEIVGKMVFVYGDRLKPSKVSYSGVKDNPFYNSARMHYERELPINFDAYFSEIHNLLRLSSELTIINWQFTGEEAKVMSRFFLPGLTKLHIINCQFLPDVNTVWPFEKLTRLKELVIRKCEISSAHLLAAVGVLASVSNLKVLEISGNRVAPEFWQMLHAQKLLQKYKLSSLSLAKGKLENCAEFIGAILASPTLTDLDLSDNPKLLPSLKTAIEKSASSSIERLYLENVGMSETEEPMWPLIFKSMKKIRELSVARNALSMKSIDQIISTAPSALPLGLLRFFCPGVVLELSDALFKKMISRKLFFDSGDNLDGMIEITNMQHLQCLISASIHKCVPEYLTQSYPQVRALVIWQEMKSKCITQDQMLELLKRLPNLKSLYFYYHEHSDRNYPITPFAYRFSKYSNLYLHFYPIDCCKNIRNGFQGTPRMKRLVVSNVPSYGNFWLELFKTHDSVPFTNWEEFVVKEDMQAFQMLLFIKHSMYFKKLRLLIFNFEYPAAESQLYNSRMELPYSKMPIKEMMLRFKDGGGMQWHDDTLGIVVVRAHSLTTLYIDGICTPAGINGFYQACTRLRTLVIRCLRFPRDGTSGMCDEVMEMISKFPFLKTLIIGTFDVVFMNSFTLVKVTGGFSRLVDLALPNSRPVLRTIVNCLPLEKMKYLQRVYIGGKIYNPKEFSMFADEKADVSALGVTDPDGDPIAAFYRESNFYGLA